MAFRRAGQAAERQRDGPDAGQQRGVAQGCGGGRDGDYVFADVHCRFGAERGAAGAGAG